MVWFAVFFYTDKNNGIVLSGLDINQIVVLFSVMVLEVLRFGTILGFDANTDLCIYLLYNPRYNLQFQINVENICAPKIF